MHHNGSINIVDESIIGKVDELGLQTKGFIKILPTGVALREKAHELFVDEKNNFYRFVNTFPIKTPKGRYLSPKSLEGVAITAIKKKWKAMLKENRSKEDHVIKVLEAEIAWRKKTNQQEFMTGIEAWLNGAFWEKYEHLLEDDLNEQASINHELM